MSHARAFQSGIFRSYPGTFVLDEAGLRRLQAQIKKLASEFVPDPTVIFLVEREDDRFYETTDIDEVLSDPNLHGTKIRALSLNASSSPTVVPPPWVKEHYSIGVTFGELRSHRLYYSVGDREENLVSMQLVSSDRNWTLLSTVAIEADIQRLIESRHPYRAAAFGIPLTTLVLLTALFKMVFDIRGGVPFLAGLHIGRAMQGSLPATFLMAGLLLMSLRFGIPPFSLPQGIRRFLVGESVFLWGDELRAHPARQRIKRHLVWGVVVAFFVSLLAGLVQWALLSA